MKVSKYLDMLHNAERFSVEKSETKGESLWFIHEGYLTSVSTDNYIAVVNRVTTEFHAFDGHFKLPRKDIKEYIKQYSEVDLNQDLSFEDLFDMYAALSENDLEEDPTGAALMYVYETVMHVRPVTDKMLVQFAVAPEKLRKLGLLKVEGEHCLDFQWSWDMEFDPVLAFKYSPEIQGIVMPLERNLQNPEGMFK